ncbi:nuclear transport factor 2 family protein [Mycolicibacterium smegmatis]|jgi:hypothetical protein|uniref:nuclear transport factor 2 family protein n=1 Tax=Mycolicibacterium smegmatis TaxID=1772 RepID=UPI0020A3A610|nr:nuclear transport factor 2 family protein [Mycolicibacterium smegmatis]MCP2626816.1 nuclear transport factor 2 family protein [Mycolicibacterium smegmatis]
MSEIANACEAVRSVVLAERAAKDLAQWDEMAACFAADASVRVSWFQGSAADFVTASKKRHDAKNTPSFHEIGSVHVRILGNRAIANASCAVHIRGSVTDATGDVAVDVVSRGRVYWRVERTDRWLIAGLDMVYMRDSIVPVDPTSPISPAAISGVERNRISYQWISLLLAQKGHRIDPDLPGVDRPDLVAEFLAAQEEWLAAV